MKKGFKKMVTGLCLGAVMLTGGLTLSGCTADITVNQDNIDEVVENLNEFLENQNGMYNTSIETLVDNLTIYLQNQNNFNSDEIDALIENLNKYLEENNTTTSKEVKEILDSYIFDGLKDSLYSTNFKIVSNYKEYDGFGNILYEEDMEYKYYTSDKMVKEYCVYSPGEYYINYRESVLDEKNEYDCKTYYVHPDDKFYILDYNYSELEPIGECLGIYSYAKAMQTLYNFFYNNESIVFNDFVMETEGDIVRFETSYMEQGDEMVARMLIEFTNGKLTKIVTEEILGGFCYTEMNFEHDIEDFTFDGSDFRLIQPE